MAGKTDIFSNDILALIFHGQPIANLADNAASAALGSLYLSLHTGNPTDAAVNGQMTSECAYTGYIRKPMARSPSGWTITGKVAVPVSDIDFAACTAGTESAAYWGIGTSPAGAGKLLYAGQLTPSILIQAGVIPRLLSTSTITDD